MSIPRRCTARWIAGEPARSSRCSSRCCSRRSCRTARSSGLLDASGGWLRERFTEIDVIQFEDWVDTGEEYDCARRSRDGIARLPLRDDERRQRSPVRGGRSPARSADVLGRAVSPTGSRSAPASATARSPRSTRTPTGSCARCGRAACRRGDGVALLCVEPARVRRDDRRGATRRAAAHDDQLASHRRRSRLHRRRLRSDGVRRRRALRRRRGRRGRARAAAEGADRGRRRRSTASSAGTTCSPRTTAARIDDPDARRHDALHVGHDRPAEGRAPERREPRGRARRRAC